MFRGRSFQTRVLLAIVAVAVVPAALAIGLGYGALRELGSATGTLGPWDAVATSGRILIDEVAQTAPADSSLQAAARDHEAALSESLRRSRLYAFVAERALRVLPVVALGTGALIGLLALWAAGRIARGIAAPVQELVGWTRRIAREEPLPSPSPHETSQVEELRELRSSLREMDGEIRAGRRREVEATRLRTWTEMARGIAHEIKNPLTPMKVAAGSLTHSGDARTVSAAQTLLEEIERLDGMARTFSQLGRLPEGPPAEVDVEEMLRTLVERHGNGVVPVRVEVAAALPMVRAHHDLLARAVLNLLVNALEAQDGGPGEVVVSAVLAEGGNRVVIAVRDRGPGVPPELADQIWRPNVTTKKRGTGLGLAMVRQAATAHGGEASVRTAPGGGAEFALEIPVRGPPLPKDT